MSLKLSLIFNLISCVLSAKILCVFPIPSFSHQITYRALTKELANKGHELVIITTDPDANASDNVKQIDVGEVSYEIVREKFLKHLKPGVYDVSLLIGESLLAAAEAQLNEPGVKELINDKQIKFDLIILEVIDRGSFIYANIFEAPVIGISSLSVYDFTFEGLGAPTHPLLYENVWDSRLKDGSILGKFSSVWEYLRRQYEEYVLTNGYNRIFKKHLGDAALTLPTLVDKLELVLMNINPVWHGPRPLPPGIIAVGGLHLQPQKQLPSDLQSLLDNSTNGVVYMSLGGNILSKDLPTETLNAILDGFKELPYTILWKWEDEELKHKSSNVHLKKWFPQGDMLGHPNIKVFITQGGQQSTDEAIRGHVPIIGIPFLGDQAINAEKFEHFEIGKRLDLSLVTKESLVRTVLEVATNPKYRRNIEKLHSQISDTQIKPVDNAIWWCEYVLKHGGAKHLHARKLSLVEYFLLDLIAIVLVGSLALYFLARFVRRALVKKSKYKNA